MERTKHKEELPDIINCSMTKEFTQIPNELLRNPNISGKAKALQCIFLSNKSGWKTYTTTIQKMMKEGKSAIRSAIKELEDHHYLIRFRYREKRTKKQRGSFWACTDTPGSFYIAEHLELLDKIGCELSTKLNDFEIENPHVENRHVGFPHVANQPLKILIYKNIKKKNNNIILSGCENQKSSNRISIKERTKKYISLSNQLANIILQKKNIKFPPKRLIQWADEMRKLHEQNGISRKRMKIVLNWYQDHIDDPYCPVIESGFSFRQKFLKLESAMTREDFSKKSKQKGNYAAQQLSSATMNKGRDW